MWTSWRPWPTSTILQDVGRGRIGFSRSIRVADAERILNKHASHADREPPRTGLAGVEDLFLEKASRTWYWHDGKWLQLAGSD